MAIENKIQLKTYFETGDRPTQSEFTNLIDSFRHIDDGATITSVNKDSQGNITIELSTGDAVFIEKETLASAMPISFIVGLQAALDEKVTVAQLNEALATSAYGIKYTWNTATERNAQTSMKKDEQGVQKDTREVYRYTGSSWELFYTLDAIHHHDDRYYTESESDTKFITEQRAISDALTSTSSVIAASSKAIKTVNDKVNNKLDKTEKAADADKLDGVSWENVNKPINTEISENSWAFKANTIGTNNFSGIWFTGKTGRLLLRDSSGSVKTMLAANGSSSENVINGHKIWHAGNHGSGSGLDADKLDGLDSSAFIKNANLSKATYFSGDVNTITKPGFYFANSASTNKPANGVLLHGNYKMDDASFDSQILVSHATNTLYFRSKDYGSWESWKEIIHNDNIEDFKREISDALTSTSSVIAASSKAIKTVNDKVNNKLDKTEKATDADKLDGLDSSAFLRSGAADTATGLITFNAGLASDIINPRTNQQLVLNAGESAGKVTGQTNEHVYINAEQGLSINTPSVDNWGTNYSVLRTIIRGHSINMNNGKSILTSLTSGGLRFQSPTGFLDIGSLNTSHCHFSTDRGSFYFNKQLLVDTGIIRSYNEDLNLNRAGSSSARIRITNGTTYSDQNFVAQNNIYGKSVNAAYSHLYRFGGIHFTWDSDSYGTNAQHSIKSAYGVTMGDSLTMNSYNNIRLNIDSNNNNSNSKFEIGHNTSGTANVLFTVEETGTITASGNVCAFSDKRLKSNIKPLSESILDKINALRPSFYNWKDTSKDQSRQLGFIAQEVKEVFPEWVQKRDEHYAMSYDKMGAVLAVKGIQELTMKNEILQAELLQMKKELSEIKTLLKQ